MATFFSAIQGKFKEKYDGRYLGHIIEQISEIHPSFITPIINRAPLKYKPSTKRLCKVTAEFTYKKDYRDSKIADLEIALTQEDRTSVILVEIKMRDKLNKNQLDNYINWAKQRSAREDRAVVVLTAYPLEKIHATQITQESAHITHLYLSDFIREIPKSIEKKEIIQIFKNYISEEGYSMYQLTKSNSEEYKAFLSFMVLNFLPHVSGHGKVSSTKSISQGPIIFGRIVQNWQLISERLASNLAFGRIPTIRYFPQQAHSERKNEPKADLQKRDDILKERIYSRRGKQWGRYWITSECVISKEKNIRLEWGQILQIEREENDKAEDHTPLRCAIYAIVRLRTNQFGSSILWMKKGIDDPDLYIPERMIGTLSKLIADALRSSCKSDPEAQNIIEASHLKSLL